MTRVDDMRKQFEATIGNLTPARAQELAKGFLEPGAAKEQIAKTAADLLEWSQLDAVRKRVRELERTAGMTASGRRRAASRKKTTAKRTPAKKAATSSGSGGAG